MVSLLGMAGLAGVLAAWLTVILLVFPARGPLLRWRPQGFVNAGAGAFARFAREYLLADLPTPAGFFEQLGPDRFRREFSRSLRGQADTHVDDVMGRRNGKAWTGFSRYARDRVYTHVHRRLPFLVDNFVENIHRDLDDIISPPVLVERYFASHPQAAGQIFLSAFGPDLRFGLLMAGLLAIPAGWAVSLLVDGYWQPGWVAAGAAVTGSLVVLATLVFPVRPVSLWPLRLQGILHRRRVRFQRILAARIASDSLSWRALAQEFLDGPQAPRVRQLMRREVAGILDDLVFKFTLQVFIGPEGVVEVKQSAVEKAMEVLSATQVSAALQESCRIEIERSLFFAADRDAGAGYERLWEQVLAPAWKILPPVLGVLAFGFAASAAWLLQRLAG